MPYLEIRKRGGGQATRFALNGEAVSIGRASTNRLVLDDISVSRDHCVIEPLEDGGGGVTLNGSAVRGAFRIRDVGSRHGIRVNGAKVSQADLAGGDRVRIGPFELTYFADRARADQALMSDLAGPTTTADADEAGQSAAAVDDGAEVELAALRHQRDQAAAGLAQAQADAAAARDELDTTRASVRELQSQRDELAQQARQHAAQIDQMRGELDQALSAARQADEAAQAAQARAEHAQAELQALQEAVELDREQVAHGAAKAREAEDRRAQAAAQLEADLQSQLEAAHRERDEVRASLAARQSDLETITSSLGDERAALEQERAARTAEIRDLAERLAAAEEERSAAFAAQAATSLAEVQRERAELEAQLTASTHELAAMQARLDERDRLARDRLEQSAQELRAAASARDERAARVETLERDVAALRDQLAAAQHQLQQVLDQRARFEPAREERQRSETAAPANPPKAASTTTSTAVEPVSSQPLPAGALWERFLPDRGGGPHYREDRDYGTWVAGAALLLIATAVVLIAMWLAR